MAWFEYRQNNSGGSFDVDTKVCCTVWIEADGSDAADVKAGELGIYFDGCDSGPDCECCGDRWTRAGDPERTELDVAEWAWHLVGARGWTIPDARLHYADGTVIEITRQRRD